MFEVIYVNICKHIQEDFIYTKFDVYIILTKTFILRDCILEVLILNKIKMVGRNNNNILYVFFHRHITFTCDYISDKNL